MKRKWSILLNWNAALIPHRKSKNNWLLFSFFIVATSPGMYDACSHKLNPGEPTKRPRANYNLWQRFPPLILMKDHPQSSVSKFDVNHWNMLEAILNDKLYFDLFCLQYKWFQLVFTQFPCCGHRCRNIDLFFDLLSFSKFAFLSCLRNKNSGWFHINRDTKHTKATPA